MLQIIFLKVMHDIINSDTADHQCEGEDKGIFENSGIRIECSLSVHQKHGNLKRRARRAKASDERRVPLRRSTRSEWEVRSTSACPWCVVSLLRASRSLAMVHFLCPTSLYRPKSIQQMFLLTIARSIFSSFTFDRRYRRKKSNRNDFPLRKSPAIDTRAI